MKSHTTKGFRKRLASLPKRVRVQARKAYQQFQADPNYPGLCFKQIHLSPPIYSARVGVGHRAVGLRTDDTIVWYWIGSHAAYDKLIEKM